MLANNKRHKKPSSFNNVEKARILTSCHFILERKMKSSMSLTPFRNSNERHLRQQKYEHSMIESREFAKDREVLKAKKKSSRGREKAENQILLIHFQGKTERSCLNVAFWEIKAPRVYKLPFGLTTILHFGMRIKLPRTLWLEMGRCDRKQRSMAKST